MATLDVPAWARGLLAVLMLTLISIDLLAHRGDREDSRRRALIWSVVWIGAALLFNVFVWVRFGAAAGEQFLAAYLLEKSLSIDNLFLFLVIFGAFQIPKAEQRRVLTWGIIGALVTRAIFIAAGAALLERWHAVTYIFGALLVITAVKLLREPAADEQPRILHWLERRVPWTRQLHGHKFFARVNGRRVATPLLLALIAIELTDVMFAVDSIPAAFAVTSDPFLVYSSNVFAILGLRALYIVLAGAIAELRYLRFGLSAVLAFAGAKMLLAHWVTVDPLLSVGVIVACIGASVIASLTRPRLAPRQEAPAPSPVPMEH
jgi:tellurite resistance protein TerC